VLWSVIAFVALQLGLTLARESLLPELRDPAFGAKIKHLHERAVQAGRSCTTVVMLGSSRTMFGFRGKLLEEQLQASQGQAAVIFNLGIYGSGPVSELLHLRSLLALGIRPDLLLVEVAPMFLDDQTEREELGRLPADRLGRDEVPVVERYSGRLDASLRADWWQAAAVPIYAHRLVILSELLPVMVPGPLRVECCGGMDDSGWLALRLSPQVLTPVTHLRALEGLRAEWGPALGRLTASGKGMQALRELLTVGRQANLRMALVLMPEGPCLRSCYSPQTWQPVYAALADMSREFDSPLVNARDWVAEEHFTDSHHLLPAGATVFSERLGREFIRPILRAQQIGSPANLLSLHDR
jgi:hypothetical protein